MHNVVTIREAVQRAKNEGLPVSEYALRTWVRSKAIPARKVGQKALIFYPNLVAYLRCDNISTGVCAMNIPAGTTHTDL